MLNFNRKINKKLVKIDTWSLLNTRLYQKNKIIKNYKNIIKRPIICTIYQTNSIKKNVKSFINLSYDNAPIIYKNWYNIICNWYINN